MLTSNIFLVLCQCVSPKIVQSSSPIICQMELGFQLQQMGFVHLQGRKAYLTCELFRYFFRDLLP
jgi:hypothetical protein